MVFQRNKQVRHKLVLIISGKLQKINAQERKTKKQFTNSFLYGFLIEPRHQATTAVSESVVAYPWLIVASEAQDCPASNIRLLIKRCSSN